MSETKLYSLDLARLHPTPDGKQTKKSSAYEESCLACHHIFVQKADQDRKKKTEHKLSVIKEYHCTY